MSSLFWFFMISFVTVDASRLQNRWYKPLLRGVKLQSATDSLSKESLSEARKASKQTVARSELSNCKPCRSKDLSNPCPEQWALQEESCHAPLQYKGLCATMQTFIGDSATEKREAHMATPLLRSHFLSIHSQKHRHAYQTSKISVKQWCHSRLWRRSRNLPSDVKLSGLVERIVLVYQLFVLKDG